MKIRLTMIGSMHKFLSRERIDLDLNENATLSDIYDALAEIAREETPSAIWNPAKKRFRGPVIVSTEGCTIKDENTRLHDGQEIEFKRFLIGG